MGPGARTGTGLGQSGALLEYGYGTSFRKDSPTAKPLIVITGADSGIGGVTARLFSARGPPLLLFARRRERLEGPNITVREIVLAVTGQVA